MIGSHVVGGVLTLLMVAAPTCDVSPIQADAGSRSSSRFRAKAIWRRLERGAIASRYDVPILG